MTATPDLASLMQAHAVHVWRYVRYLGSDASLADDLTQETFLAVWRSEFVDHGHSATAAYLRTIARRRYLDHCKRARRVESRADFEALIDRLDAHDETWTRVTPAERSDERLDALAACLGTALSDREREAIQRRYAESQPGTEIAEALACSVNAVKSLLKRARNRLAQCLERRLAP